MTRLVTKIEWKPAVFKSMRVRTNILLTITAVVAILAVSLLALQLYLGERLAHHATHQAFMQTAEKIQSAILSRDTLAKERIRLMAHYPDLAKPPLSGEPFPLTKVEQFAQAMAHDPQIYAIYVGYPNGNLFEVISMSCASGLYESLDAPKATRWIVFRVFDTPHHGRIRVMDFLDEDMELLRTRDVPTDYDSRTRPWFMQTEGQGDIVRSAPYLFSSIQQLGITFSYRLPSEQGAMVLALDYTLQGVSALLKAQSFFASGALYLFSDDGVLNASSVGDHVTDRALADAVRERRFHQIFRYSQAGVWRYGLVIPLDASADHGAVLGLSVSVDEMLAPYVEGISYAFVLALLILLLMYPVVRYATSLIVQPIKDLMEENDKIKARQFDRVRAVKTNITEFIELSNSQLALSQSILEYEQAQKNLLKSFVRLIADAIDEKSPYTGGHCKRVPLIAMQLAKVAEAHGQGSLAMFSFHSQDDRDAFEMGAWLHDCGKITTPEFVVDKATKLETLYNRIHEIRTRFEVLWRDIDIEALHRLQRGENPAEVTAWQQTEHQALQDDFAFVAACNQGGEFMHDADVQRLARIAQRTWQRHFDDRLGLSADERLRYSGEPALLPAEEHLLADKPEHRVPRTDFDADAYARDGFVLDVPELLYHRGELYNLSIRKGTLSAEERFKIMEHVIMSIKLLEQIPFPEEMRRIPEYAGTHHETLDGHGYPRGLDAGQLSIPARIMAIADIFEALTASDRPYKPGKPLSEALSIMQRMVTEGHLDAELFALFLRSGVCSSYAGEHLKPEQVDVDDFERYLPKLGERRCDGSAT